MFLNKNGVEFNQKSKSDMCNVWPVAGREQEGKKCRKDAHTAEINYDLLVAHSALPCFKSLADYIEKFLQGAEQISQLSVLWRKFWARCQCSPDSNLLLPRTRWPSCWRTGPTRSWSSRRWRRTSEVNILQYQGPLLPLTGSIVGVDRWYPPQDVPKHTRFVIMLNKESFRGWALWRRASNELSRIY